MATKSNSSVSTGSTSTSHIGQRCEAQLLAAAKNGHQAAFGELYARHSKKVYRTALRIVRNHEDAEDAAQDCFLNAYVHLRSFDGRSSFSTWLTRIAINSVLMRLRKDRACPEIPMDEPINTRENFAPYGPVDPDPNPEERYAQQERGRIVTGAINDLRPRLRQVIEIRRLQEFSTKETARILGISMSAAKSRLFHARTALRKVPRLRAIGQRRIRRAA